MKNKFVFNSAKKASICDFFNESDFVYDETISGSYKNVAELRLARIKKLAYKVQKSLIEGFNKTGGAGEKLEKLGTAFNDSIDNLDYGNLETVKESLSGTFLGLMIILGLSQKVHGEHYWSKEKGWDDFDSWLSSMNKNIYALDEEVKKLLNTQVKA